MKSNFLKIGVVLVLISAFGIYKLFINSEGSYSKISKQEYTALTTVAKETCLVCHSNTKGYSKFHNPDLIGCASCHLGNVEALTKEDSHKGMVLIPGNLADAKETCGKCHPNELHKIENSLMTTNSGLVAVDKFIFGEADSPNYQYHIQQIKNSPSDKHLRDLCANCHLGAEKKDFGAITQLSRGGGCNACHLNYSEAAKKELQTYITSNKKKLPQSHPSTDIFVSNEHCFGCHSRSSRISTNYEGWQETLLDEEELTSKEGFRVLEDKRVYKYVEEDVHHTKGLLCIDCHSSHEVMGDGKKYAHEEQAVKLQCSDCHFKNKPNIISYDSLDTESLLVFMHREYSHIDKGIISVKNGGHPLVNTFVDSLGNTFLIGKKDKELYPLNPQSEVCSRDNAHKNMACSTCHSSWTTRCIGCHNEFDKDESKAFDLLDRKYVKGQWKEFVAEFGNFKPALGVRINENGKHIEPAVPGMILTIDKGSYAGEKNGEDVSFHRLYAPNSPHTTTSKVRDCKSCHTNSTTLGYGNGELIFIIENGVGKWQFTPEYALNENDNLPEDSWIPFLGETPKGVVNSTRTDFRPFTINEQKELLTVGACLQCHKDDSKVMEQSIVLGIKPLLNKLSEKCVVPVWN
ncbi:hypothetical protein R3X25_14515 [Lutibacter sp. TH_r2]|uniref:hypothetical protein n=1 Tax=Lutibacter sp. TH_r2 TaxID=3082083 RepID=UPI002955BC60|nr:hypothetical protein [Lutibacter sp. TH_r2]MDV7188500.1 hypothetical protein [Lutibacter sp. TH_r2]